MNTCTQSHSQDRPDANTLAQRRALLDNSECSSQRLTANAEACAHKGTSQHASVASSTHPRGLIDLHAGPVIKGSAEEPGLESFCLQVSKWTNGNDKPTVWKIGMLKRERRQNYYKGYFPLCVWNPPSNKQFGSLGSSVPSPAPGTHTNTHAHVQPQHIMLLCTHDGVCSTDVIRDDITVFRSPCALISR